MLVAGRTAARSFPLPFVFLAMTLLLGAAGPAKAGTLLVRVRDGASGVPLAGAFVQVGPAPDDPFPGNSMLTGVDGTASFSHALLTGPQTVTAACEGYARQSVIGSAVDSVSMRLRPEVAPSGLPEPKAEVGGTVTGIATQNNDLKLDVGIVYPAIGLSDILHSGSMPFEVPADTVDFPWPVGQVVLPGNVMLPVQTEYVFYTFSKTHYHFYVPDGRTYDFVVLSGRLPISSFGGSSVPLNETVMRQVGAERSIAVNGDRTLDLLCDLLLQHSLTVYSTEPPNGTEVFVTTVADLPGVSRSLFFDAKSALRDTLDSFLLSGFNPTGDLGDAVPYFAGYYADSSVADEFQAGRVDRSPLTLPATRTLEGFFLLPELTQWGEEWRWTDVGRPGVTPDPTWTIQTFRVGPETPGDAGVTARTCWEAWVPAGDLSFHLPVLASGAPGGIPDPGQTPENDEIFWDCWIADPSGSLQQAMDGGFATLTRWSRRTIPVEAPAVVPDEVALGTVARSLGFRLVPNPGASPSDVLWDPVPRRGEKVSWSIVSPSGRRLASGAFECSGAERDSNALGAADRLPTGVYFVRLEREGRRGTVPLLVIR